MDRRNFLASIAAVPAVAAIRDGEQAPATPAAPRARQPRRAAAAPRSGGLPRGKITRVRIYEPPNLNPLFNQSNMLCTVETDIGITGIGEGGVEGHARAVRRHADRQGPVQDRGDLAGDVHRLVLSAGPREDARARRDGPGAVGHQGQGARPAACTSCSAAACATTASATARPPCCPARTASRGRSPTAPRRRWTPAIAPSAWAPADMPVGGVYNTHDAVRRVIQQCTEARAGRRPERRLVHRLPPALRLQRRAARLPRHRGVRALLRRGSGARSSTR